MVFGANPADPFGCGDDDEDMPFAPDTSLSWQFAQRLGNWPIGSPLVRRVSGARLCCREEEFSAQCRNTATLDGGDLQ